MRCEPAFPLGRWRARNWPSELHTPDLRFTSAEAAVLFQHAEQCSLSAEDLNITVERNEEWGACLNLATLVWQG